MPKEYGLYDMKDFETCIYIGNIKEIAKIVNESEHSLRSYLSKHKRGKIKYIRQRYEIVEIDKNFKDDSESAEVEYKGISFDKFIKPFIPEKTRIRKFDEFKWKIKLMADEVIAADEEWKKIKNSNYSVSNYGRIRNDKNGRLKAIRFRRWILETDIYINGKRYTVGVARLVAMYFIRELKENEIVLHIDGDARNNYYKNLKIVCK